MVSTDSNSTRSNSFCHWLWASFCGPQFPHQSQGSGHATTLQNMVEGLLVWPGRQMIVGIILLCVNETAIYCFEPAHHCQQMQGARLGTSTGAAFQYRSLTHGGCFPAPRSVSLCTPHWPHSDFQPFSCLSLSGVETQAEAILPSSGRLCLCGRCPKGLHTQQWRMSQ